MSISKFILPIFILFLIGCSNDAPKNTDTTTTNTTVTPSTSAPTPTTSISPSTPTPPPADPAAKNADGVYHYSCPNGCAGGAAGPGACATCSAQLAHNPAFHNNPSTPAAPTATPAAPPGTITPTRVTPPAGTPGSPAPAPAPQASPAQNAAGVFHYSCPNGCAGGAAAAGPCAGCGTTLVHNPTYHQ